MSFYFSSNRKFWGLLCSFFRERFR